MVSVKYLHTTTTSGLPAPLPEYKPVVYNGPNPELQKKLAAAAKPLLAKENFISGTFRNNLEKHLDDVKKNKSYLSLEVSKELRSKHQENSSDLGVSEIAANSKYAAYYTALNYEQRARFTTGVNEANRAINAIQSASHDSSQFEALLSAHPISELTGVVVDESA